MLICSLALNLQHFGYIFQSDKRRYSMVTNAAGIDVSHYQKRIDWVKVQNSGASFAIIKATEGNNFIDPRFDYNWTRARRMGIVRGAYHFFRPKVDPVAQANLFLKIAGQTLHSTDLPPVVDIEASPEFVRLEWKELKVEERLRRVQAWLKTVEGATGRKPMIYTGFYSWFDYLGNSEMFVEYPLWIAAYNVEKPRIPANNWGGHGWTFWQTTGRGVVPGIRDEAACVDLNVFRSTQHDLYNWIGFNEGRALPPEITNGDMMAAVIDTADALHISSDTLVAQAGLNYLVEPVSNSLRPYDGPAVSELALEPAVQTHLQAAVDVYLGTNASFYRITHQDLLNAFYYAASLEDIGGWKLVTKAGLAYLTEDRSAVYNGPVIEDLPGLTLAQKEAILSALGVYENTAPVAENPVEEPEGEVPIEEEGSAPELQPEEPVPADPPTVEETIPTYGKGVNNQDVVNAFYLTAIKLDQNGQEMMEAAGLAALIDDRLSVYTGPRVEELPGLSDVQRVEIAAFLEVDLGDWTPSELIEEPAPVEESEAPVEPEAPAAEPTAENEEQIPAPEPETPIAPTYPGLVNQDVINLFYKAAALFGENGWHWVARAGLGAIGESRLVRFLDYIGPDLTEISGLNADQKAALQHELAQYR